MCRKENTQENLLQHSRVWLPRLLQSRFLSQTVIRLSVVAGLRITAKSRVCWRSRPILTSQSCSAVRPSGKSWLGLRRARITRPFGRCVQMFEAFLLQTGFSPLRAALQEHAVSTHLKHSRPLVCTRSPRAGALWDEQRVCVSTERRSGRWFHQRHL